MPLLYWPYPKIKKSGQSRTFSSVTPLLSVSFRKDGSQGLVCVVLGADLIQTSRQHFDNRITLHFCNATHLGRGVEMNSACSEQVQLTANRSDFGLSTGGVNPVDERLNYLCHFKMV